MPIRVTDGIFQNALQEALAHQSGAMNKNVAWANRLARFCAPFIDDTETFLVNLRNSANYHLANLPALAKLTGRGYPATYSVIDEAFTKPRRAKLLGVLGAMLHYPAWQYYEALYAQAHPHVGLPPPTPAPNPTANQATTLHGANVLAGHVMRKITHFFQQSLQLACDRIVEDWVDVESLFFEGSDPNPAVAYTMCKLVELKLSGSECHKQGRQLIFLKFRMFHDNAVAAPGNFRVFMARFGHGNLNVLNNNQTEIKKLVYKPSDLEFDCRMVGDTAALAARVPGRAHPGGLGVVNPNTHLPDLAAGSLIELLNGLGAAPPLPTYRLFPRKPGSLRPDAQIADSYGYIEFLSHLPERTTIGGAAPDKANMPGATWDWIARNAADLQAYYDMLGWCIAIALIFSFNDAHDGNFIVHGKRPNFIDLEASMGSAVNAFPATLMTEHFVNGMQVGRMCRIWVDHGGGNHPTMNANADLCTAVGLMNALAFFTANYLAIDAWMTTPALAQTVVRYVPRMTRTYGQMLQRVLSQDFMLAPVPGGLAPGAPLPALWFNDPAGVTVANPTGMRQPFQGFLLDPIEGDYQKFYNNINDPFTRGFPVFALSTPDHDWECLLNGDFPAFYRRLGNRVLLDARGAAVNVPAPLGQAAIDGCARWVAAGLATNGPRAIAGPAFFDHDPDPFRPTPAPVPLAGPPPPALVPRNGIQIVRWQLARCDPPNAAAIVPGSAPVLNATRALELQNIVQTVTAHTATWNEVCPVPF